MEKSKRKHSDQPIRVFKQDWFSKLFILGLITMMILFFAYSVPDMQWDSPVALPALVFFIIVYGLIVTFWFMSLSNKTEIFEDGIGVQHGNGYIFTTWDNLSHLEVRAHGRSTIVGIVTHEPLEHTVKGGFIERLLHYKHDMQFLDLGALHLPQKSDGFFGKQIVDYEELAMIEFGRLLKEYAPHLLEGVKAK